MVAKHNDECFLLRGSLLVMFSKTNWGKGLGQKIGGMALLAVFGQRGMEGGHVGIVDFR